MRKLLDLFRNKPGPRAVPSVGDRNDRENNPVASAKFMGNKDGPIGTAAAYEGEAFQREFEGFFAVFCHRPGERLIEYIESSGDDRLRSWFDWKCPEPEPKALAGMMIALAHSGRNIWDQEGITLYLQGRWSRGGGPSEQSQECLSVISQLIGKPISVFYHPEPSRPPESMKVLRFLP